MPYQRPKSETPPKADRLDLLRDYFHAYQQLALEDPSQLNQKVPREVFSGLLDEIGTLIQQRAREYAESTGAIRGFLDQNPPPGSIASRLPDEFRAFCLALNAVKQWTAAEQQATDRFILGGSVRSECRSAAEACLVTGKPLTPGEVDLHHPIRDGRPPIPLSREGHALLEGQVSGLQSAGDPTQQKLKALRTDSSQSWLQLQRGCLDLLGQEVSHSTPRMQASARTFARKAAKATGLSYQELLHHLHERDLVPGTAPTT